MRNEVYNSKGEIIHDPDMEKWYQLSSSTRLLIGGLILFNVGCFVNPGIIDQLFRLLDVRLWPWWYFLCLILVIVFSVKWFLVYRDGEDYDELQAETAKRFIRMSVTLAIFMLVAILLHVTTWSKALFYPLFLWYQFGTMTWAAPFICLVLFAIFGLAVYLIKEWFVSHWE